MRGHFLSNLADCEACTGKLPSQETGIYPMYWKTIAFDGELEKVENPRECRMPPFNSLQTGILQGVGNFRVSGFPPNQFGCRKNLSPPFDGFLVYSGQDRSRIESSAVSIQPADDNSTFGLCRTPKRFMACRTIESLIKKKSFSSLRQSQSFSWWLLIGCTIRGFILPRQFQQIIFR